MTILLKKISHIEWDAHNTPCMPAHNLQNGPLTVLVSNSCIQLIKKYIVSSIWCRTGRVREITYIKLEVYCCTCLYAGAIIRANTCNTDTCCLMYGPPSGFPTLMCPMRYSIVVYKQPREISQSKVGGSLEPLLLNSPTHLQQPHRAFVVLNYSSAL